MLDVILSDVFIFLSFLLSSVAGFAGAAFSVPLISGIIGLTNAQVTVNIISLIFNFTVVFQERRHLDMKNILPILLISLCGMGIGYVISMFIPSEKIFLRILGVLILCVVIFNLFMKKEIKLNRVASVIIILLSGIVNYMFVCGGIVLVLYMSQRFTVNEEFRCNNAVIFFIQSAVFLLINSTQGTFTQTSLIIALTSVIPVIVATIIGKQILRKIDRKLFKKITYVLLGIMALIIIF